MQGFRVAIHHHHAVRLQGKGQRFVGERATEGLSRFLGKGAQGKGLERSADRAFGIAVVSNARLSTIRARR